MNRADIDSLTARIQVGSLVQLLFQAKPVFGLVVAISKSENNYIDGRKERAMTFVTMMTKEGLRKYPIYWCEPID